MHFSIVLASHPILLLPLKPSPHHHQYACRENKKNKTNISPESQTALRHGRTFSTGESPPSPNSGLPFRRQRPTNIPPGRSESSFQVRPLEVSNATKFLGGRFFSLFCGVNYFLRLARTCFGYTSFLWINSGYSALVSQMAFLFHI